MANPRESYPETATNGGRTPDDGGSALREALRAHDEDLAAAVERTDELGDVLTTAILVVASADEADLDHVTESAANLVEAADGLTTAEAADLATTVGDTADDLSAALDTVVDLQRAGHLDDLATVAAAFSSSLTPADVENLAATLERNGPALVEALDTVLELQREGRLADLVDLAGTLAALDVDRETAEGLNALLGAVGDAQRDPRAGSLRGVAGRLWSGDVRTGVGYLVALVGALGRRVRR